MPSLENLPAAFEVLRGPRVTLRPFCEADIPLREKWVNDPEITFMITGQITDPDEISVQNWWECHQDNPYTTVLAIDNEERQYIGDIDFYVENARQRTCGLNILLGEKSQWGKGYASEALRTLLEFSFSRLRLNAVLLNVFEFNTRAIRCYERCGFEFFESIEQVLHHSGQHWEWITYRCTPGSFHIAQERRRRASSPRKLA